MYIENDCAGINMSDEVNEATAALKGMLGIGSPIGSSSSTTTTPVKEAEEPPKKSKKKKANKKKKKKDNAGSEGGSGKNKGQQTAKKGEETSEKFAWSAFQASPDASALPIPAFSTPAKTKSTVNAETVSRLTETTRGTPVVIGDEVAPAAVDVETKNVKSDTVQEIETKTVEPPPAAEEEAPVSNTGINLAALAASPPPQPQSAPGQAPIPVHAPPSYQQLPPMYNNMSPQQHPQYVTIQVQVPPVLLPGRQMVVASPLGYPVQVRVPDGVPPGMIIPVHVPVAPPPQPPPPYNNPYLYGRPPP